MDCKLDKGFVDLCSAPKPLPRGTIVLGGRAIIFHKKQDDLTSASKDKKPVYREAADIDEIGRHVSMKVKVLRKAQWIVEARQLSNQRGYNRFLPGRRARTWSVHPARPPRPPRYASSGIPSL